MLNHPSCNKLVNPDKYHKKICNNDVEFVVFYKNLNTCPYSNEAIIVLKKHKKTFKAYCIDDSSKNIDMRADLLKHLITKKTVTGFDTNHKTLPIIFHKGQFVGGYAELKIMLDS